MDKIAHASPTIREELFSQSAYALNTTNAIIEKDFWVVWILDKILAHAPLNKILMFKGGTSPWAKFDEAKTGTLKLVPPQYRLEALKKDYEAMQHMIFEKQCSFDELMMILQTLEDTINH
jgi:hypothetical protein